MKRHYMWVVVFSVLFLFVAVCIILGSGVFDTQAPEPDKTEKTESEADSAKPNESLTTSEPLPSADETSSEHEPNLNNADPNQAEWDSQFN